MTAIANNEKLTTIANSTSVITLINIFTVEPENQQCLVELIVKITVDVMIKLLGLISANIHKSLDEKQVKLRPVDEYRDRRHA